MRSLRFLIAFATFIGIVCNCEELTGPNSVSSNSQMEDMFGEQYYHNVFMVGTKLV